ncbi:MAG: aldo/keto reductase [Eubacterium sp.]|nr:aldo/keto reductase [Eubacterium sp.]MBR2278221.1 aldo/keto reductase [Eubacterium sp.]
MYTANEKRYENAQFNYLPNGLALPKISVGLWQNFGCDADYDEIKDIILTAFDMGVTHFDLANNYGPQPGDAERNFGKIFAENLKPYRNELIISTKAGYEMWDGPYGGRGGTRKYLMSSLDDSLSRMGLDYVDIFYHHCMTPETPLDETALALSDIIRQGKSLYAGISNYDGKKMHRMHHRCEDYNVPFIINQNRYSILDRTVERNGLKRQCRKKEKGLIAFSPLAQGRLSHKFKDGIPKDSRLYGKEDYCKNIGLDDKQLEQIKILCNIAEERGETLSQMAIQWLLANGVTSVLIGVRTKTQLLENLQALEKPPLTEDELIVIDEVFM